VREVELFGVKGGANYFLSAVKAVSLVILGPIVVTGNLDLTVVGGLLGCPFTIPFIMCNACPKAAFCMFGLIRPWFFSGIVAVSLLVGRVFCGILCPLGILNEFMFKLPVQKASMTNIDGKLRLAKYGVLILFFYLAFEAVTLLLELPPIGRVWSFMTMHQEKVRIILLVAVLIIIASSIFFYRAWCRYFCPIGTLSSLFNKFSLLSIKRDHDKCDECQACSNYCPVGLGIDISSSSPDCFKCFRCYAACKQGALRLHVRRAREE